MYVCKDGSTLGFDVFNLIMDKPCQLFYFVSLTCCKVYRMDYMIIERHELHLRVKLGIMNFIYSFLSTLLVTNSTVNTKVDVHM